MTARTFLFLQGPHGPVFRDIGAALRAEGHAVLRVNLNGGDRLDWPEGQNFRRRREEWPGLVDRLLLDNDVTDVVLFGDSRPMHRIAHGVATMRGLTVHVFEEGYLRPDFVTLERGGVNGHSKLPRDADHYRREGAALPPFAMHEAEPAEMRERRRLVVRHSFASFIGHWRFPHYRTHRLDPISMECIFWARRVASGPLDRHRTRQGLSALNHAAYFALPLQLNSDFQLRTHSSFGDMRAAANYVIRSFARNAPRDHLLAVKRHPLDSSIVNWRRVLRRAGRAEGVTDRIVFLPGGDVGSLVAGARGVVTVNSTVGTLALNAGVPVKALGRAVYAIPGLADQQHLDDFWSAPQPPDPELYESFRRVIARRSLIPGNFISAEGCKSVVQGAVARLTADAS